MNNLVRPSRIALFKLAVVAAACLVVATVVPTEAATPAGGRVSATKPTVAWSGGPFLAFNPTADTDCIVPEAPYCDSFRLKVDPLTAERPDVIVSVVGDSDATLINVAIYDSAGNNVADAGALGTAQNITLYDPVPGNYWVRVELMLGIPASARYDARATTVLAPEAVDMEQECIVEETTVITEPDDGRRVDLDVLVLLDGVDEAYARDFFRVVNRPYKHLNVYVVPTFQVADPPFVGTATADILNQARARFPGGKVPPQFDVVEVLTSKDIQLAGQTAIAGQADCLGGLAYDERSYNVSEAATGIPDEGIPIGPVTLGAEYSAKITAHEIGHLLGGQHHYANCVEGIDPARESQDTSPCTLMANAADVVSLQFGALNGKIVRGYALKYASQND